MHDRERVLQKVLSRCQRVKASGGGYLAACPCHDDRHQSLSIAGGTTGVVLKCHAGCDTRAVVQALGLETRELFYQPAPGKGPGALAPEKQIVAIYHYPNGAQKLRYGDKHFAWRQPDGQGGWQWNRKGLEPCLYRKGDCQGVVYLVEGEKDADNFHALTGESVVSGQDGAGPGKWKPQYTRELAGKLVLILPDNDPVGRDYAREAARALKSAGCQVKILDLALVWPEIPLHGDVSDFIAHHRQDPRAFCDAITDLMVQTAEYEGLPPQDSPGPGDRPGQGDQPGQGDSPDLGDRPGQGDRPDLPPVRVKTLAEVKDEPIRWLLEPFFQKGTGTLIQGDNGSGKTAFMCAVAAHVTTGQPILGMEIETPGKVLLLSTEDGEQELKRRVRACGGDMEKVIIPQEEDLARLHFRAPEIESLLWAHRPQLVVFDPLQHFLGAGVDMHRANETRPVFSNLFALCKKYDCACAIISHMGKSAEGRSSVNRALGSVDIPSAMRCILQLAEDPEEEGGKVMVHVKSSHAPFSKSIAYTIGAQRKVTWRGFHWMTKGDLEGGRAAPREPGVDYEEEPLVEVFRHLMERKPQGGFWSYKEILAIGEEVTGVPPFGSTAELKGKLDARLCKLLLERDGIVVRLKQRGTGGAHGLRLERHPVTKGEEE